MKSMTGFAQGRFEFNNISLHILIRSWNHRFLDINYKGIGLTPESEKMLKEIVKERVFRGKIEIVFDLFQSDRSKYDIRLNDRLLTDILDELVYFKRNYKEKISLSMDTLLKIPMIFRLDYAAEQFEERDAAEIRKHIEKVFKEFLKSRTEEGKSISKDLLNNIKKIEINLKAVKKEADQLEKDIFSKYKEKIGKYLKEFEIDERRIIQEAAILAEKGCINEEIHRLDTHTRRLKELVKNTKMDVKGKEADFLAQEMLRETHTISSKTNSMEIHEQVLVIRREIEKIKQQVQNVE
ncbi:MAG: DUF1732 domain-containing protein [bacterium]|nr:DUF1732 domain-containing protein [bacterium]